VLLGRDQFSAAPSPDGFHAPALHAAPYRSLHSGEGAVDRILEGDGLALKYHARKTAQDHFDTAHLIDATPGAVHILYANADAFDGGRVLSELHAKSLPDICAVILIEFDSGYPDIRRNLRRIRAAGPPLQRSGEALRERHSLLITRSTRAFVRPLNRRARAPTNDRLSAEPFAAAWRSQQLPFAAAHRAGGAAERIKYVGGCHDTHEPIAVEHGQGANQPLSHEIGRLADRGLRLDTLHVRRHQVLDSATCAHIATGSAAEIAFGEDPDEPLTVYDHQVANAAAAHPSPGFARRFFGPDSYDPGAHDLVKPRHTKPATTRDGALRVPFTSVDSCSLTCALIR
jgi:hypothetical protein